MASLFAPNRVAAYSVVLNAVASAVLEVTGVLPHNWQATAVIVGQLAAHAATGLKFMEGSQRYDSIQADQALYASHRQTAIAVAEPVTDDVTAPAADVPISYVPGAGSLTAQNETEAAAPESTPTYDPAQS